MLYNFINVSKAKAATINASSASRVDVLTAIGTAIDGDTVIVPSGTVTWSSLIPLSEELTILGAGIDNTIITGYLFDVANGTDNWRISGFYLDCNKVDAWQLDVGQSNRSDGCRNFRIDNCKFVDSDYYPIRIAGQSYGVIDHCTFLNNHGGIDVAYGYNLTWADSTYLGSEKFVFVEDCIFTNDTNSWRNTTHIMMGNQGGRFVFRNNEVYEQSGGYRIDNAIDMHGYGHASGFQRLGTRAYEVYGNTFTKVVNACCSALAVRGGTGVIYNNTFDESVISYAMEPIKFIDSRLCEGNGRNPVTTPYTAGGCGSASTNFCDSARGGEDYACCNQIGRGMNEALEPVHVWGNVDHNSNTVGVSVAGPSCLESLATFYIVENRDYYLNPKPGYTAYTYPHPLVSPSQGKRPDPPQIIGIKP